MITTGTPKTNRSALPLEIQQNTSASRVEKKKKKTSASNYGYVRGQIYAAVNWYTRHLEWIILHFPHHKLNLHVRTSFKEKPVMLRRVVKPYILRRL